ncbi:hypothetical protein ACFX12_006670 [Malus domestica]
MSSAIRLSFSLSRPLYEETGTQIHPLHIILHHCLRQEFPSGTFPGRRAHSSPGGWRRLRAAVGLLLHCRALSGKARRARLIGQDSSGTACRARLEEKDNVNFERCLCGALGVGLEAHNQN